VFENKILKKIFGSKGEKARECWRKLHNQELYTQIVGIIR
jgi:hypothetical protein